MKDSTNKKEPLEFIINQNGKLTKCFFYFFNSPVLDKLYLRCYAMISMKVELSDLTEEDKRKIVCLN
jgi:hypothetical protein